MSGISHDSILEFQARIARFKPSYIRDWDEWLATPSPKRPYQFGVVLRRWQACRPNKMRRTRADRLYPPPYLEDLIAQSTPYIQSLQSFDVSLATSFTQSVYLALSKLWAIFEKLSYEGPARNGLAGAVGISKAVLLLSEGRVGPAFDSGVKKHLDNIEINNAGEWIGALKRVTRDIHAFEVANATTLQRATPEYTHLHAGRIYDMALGPRWFKTYIV
jgi:hypothetical protein